MTRILFVASTRVDDFVTGPGLIMGNTLNSVSEMGGIECDVLYYRVAVRGSGHLSSRLIARVKEVDAGGRPLSRLRMLAGALFGMLTLEDYMFLKKLNAMSGDYDAVLWFGSAYDPITSHIASWCASACFYHVNDSITVFSKRRGQTFLGQIKTALARLIEVRNLKSGFKRTIYVSEVDYAQAESLVHAKSICLPLGVDLGYFRPKYRACGERIRVLFCGVMAYGPNDHAARYLIERISPLLGPEFDIRIAGRCPSVELNNAAASAVYNNVVVTGEVSSMVDEYCSADIFVAPMFLGAGMQNKILEAMACELPVVTTPICAQAFEVVPPGLLIASSEKEFQTIVVNLANDEELRRRLGACNRSYLKANMSWQARTFKLLTFLK